MLFCAGWLSCGTAVASAQDVRTIDSQAQVLAEISLANTRDMDFGRLIVPTNGRVDMTAEENPTCTPNNGIVLVDACESASFVGRAGSGFQIRISVPAGRRINLTGPGRDLRLRQMTVGAGDGLTFLGRSGRNFDFQITDPNGDYEFHVGGRLLFRNNQAVGLYTGTFTIETEFQ